MNREVIAVTGARPHPFGSRSQHDFFRRSSVHPDIARRNRGIREHAREYRPRSPSPWPALAASPQVSGTALAASGPITTGYDSCGWLRCRSLSFSPVTFPR